ncbi:DoxX family membrane protein [Sphaerisporangium flaviroseum]|uniref:DoxX family membrane protein n=1 Tax=Sphaerisporangium flaviroseum TaxID=509199 RepID=A0ABP7IXB1_9ACTN
MAGTAEHRHPAAASVSHRLTTDPVFQAFWLLRIGFTVAPVLFGLDKFAGLLTDWDRYLAPAFDRLAPGTAHQAMLAVGVIEVVAGLTVAALPRFGGYLVAAWLGGIIINLLVLGDFYDVALRDLGLLLGALTLARLAAAVRHQPALPGN